MQFTNAGCSLPIAELVSVFLQKYTNIENVYDERLLTIYTKFFIR